MILQKEGLVIGLQTGKPQLGGLIAVTGELRMSQSRRTCLRQVLVQALELFRFALNFLRVTLNSGSGSTFTY